MISIYLSAVSKELKLNIKKFIFALEHKIQKMWKL